MKESESNQEEKLLLNKVDSNESNNQATKTNINEFPMKNEFARYMKASVIKEIDIQTLIEKLNNLPCCLNPFLESIMNNPNGLSQLLEIRRKNIKIKMYSINNIDFFCQWCKENCLKYIYNTIESEININETNSKYCMCAINNHLISFYEKKIALNSEDQKEINKIIEIHNNNLIENELKEKTIKEKILNLIKGKENERILQIISYILNINFFTIYFNYNYDDEINKIILSCIKKNKECSYFNNVMYFYFNNYISIKITNHIPPIFIFNDEFTNVDSVPALYYYNPDTFYNSFFFQVYRKKIVSKSFESNEIIKFLRKNEISNDILCSHLLNNFLIPQEIFSFGLFSLDLIFKNKNIKASKFKIDMSNNIIYIFNNQNCDIFDDFMYYGKTDRICLVDNSNYFSKLFYEKVLDNLSFLTLPKHKISKMFKNILIYFPLFRLSFNDENKERILNTLSYYSYSLAQNENIFNDCDSISKTFDLIEKEIKTIVNEKRFKKYNSEQNLLIVKKLLDLYKLKYENIRELNSFDFVFLIQNLIEKDFPMILIEKVLKIIDNNDEELKNLNIYLDYIIKISLLFCTNIIGSSYIYNSNFIPKILLLLKKINFDEFFDFVFEMSFILKISFNRKIIDISFLRMKNTENSMTLKEYLFYILFRNEPIVLNDSFYYFKNFDRLLKRIKANYNFIFEKGNNIFPNCFKNIKQDESYLNIIKIIFFNMKDEFSHMNFEDKLDYTQNYAVLKDEDIFNINEKKIEDKINEEIKNCKEKIPGFIIIDIIRCLENLNQTNFYLNFEEETFFNDKKYDLTSIIMNENLPFAIKSLILNFLLKLVLTLKIDKDNNEIFWPLLCVKRNEKKANAIKLNENYLITLESKESERHLNETIKLMNIFIICIELLKKKQNSLDFNKAFIEKNGVYDFGVSIIHAINCFSNLIINTNKIHELYLLNFTKLAFKFFEIEDFFMKIINKKIDHNKIMSQFKKEFNYEEQMKNVVEVDKIIQNFIEKINSDSLNFSERKHKNIYQNFIDYNNFLTTETNNHYSSIFEIKNTENITLEDLNNFNGLDSNNNSKILNNFNKWKEYINKKAKNVKFLIDNLLDSKNKTLSKREFFYYTIFMHISNFKLEDEFILNDYLFLKYLIRQIRSDEKFFNICDDEKMNLIINDYFKIDIGDINDFKAKIIGNIIKKIYFLTNYEILISNSFSNSKHENYLSELLNCLILFLEVLGEHFNQFFHDAIFKYKFDFSIEKNHFPVEKFDDESQTFKKIEESENENSNVFSPYEILLKLHQKIFDSLNIANDENYRETQQNNLLLIFNSLTYCIIEYTNFENPVYRNIMEDLYKNYFFWKRENESFNSIFNSINFEIDHNFINKEKKIFIINNILNLFVFYLRYGPKEINKSYFYEIRNYLFYNPILYIIHTYLYTKQIINKLDENLLYNKNNIQKLIDLYKKGNFHKFQLFSLSQRYYELIFIIKKYYDFIEFNAILPDYNGIQIDSTRIIEQFFDSHQGSMLINNVIIRDESIDENQKMSIFADYSNSMDIIFSFWRIIFNDIEICVEDNKQIIYYILKPESLFLSNDVKMYYEDNIDRSSRDSKLISFYENIDSFIFEIIYNIHKKRFNLANVFYYFGLELINILFFVIHNIILIVHYYKSWKKEYSIYNEIDNDKSSKLLLILSFVHIFYIIIVIMNWFLNQFKIEYFNALTQYSNKKAKNIFDLKEKARLFQNLKNNFSSSFETIEKDFFGKISKKQKIYILLIDTIFLNFKVFPYLISLICIILYYCLSQIFLIIPLFLIANLVPTLSAIFKGLLNKIKYLIFLYSYTLIVLYIFSWIGFLFLPNLFRFEVVDKYNENIVDENNESIEEMTCSSSIQCILYFLYFGLSSGGALDLNLISFKNNYNYYLRQFFFNMFFFLFINMIFSNIFLALITDAFSEMGELAMTNDNDKNNVCFICDINKGECINQNIEFKNHIKEHSKWKYINFMCKIIMEEDVEFNKEEFYVWGLMKKKSIDWFPNK